MPGLRFGLCMWLVLLGALVSSAEKCRRVPAHKLDAHMAHMAGLSNDLMEIEQTMHSMQNVHSNSSTHNLERAASKPLWSRHPEYIEGVGMKYKYGIFACVTVTIPIVPSINAIVGLKGHFMTNDVPGAGVPKNKQYRKIIGALTAAIAFDLKVFHVSVYCQAELTFGGQFKSFKDLIVAFTKGWTHQLKVHTVGESMAYSPAELYKGQMIEMKKTLKNTEALKKIVAKDAEQKNYFEALTSQIHELCGESGDAKKSLLAHAKAPDGYLTKCFPEGDYHNAKTYTREEAANCLVAFVKTMKAWNDQMEQTMLGRTYETAMAPSGTLYTDPCQGTIADTGFFSNSYGYITCRFAIEARDQNEEAWRDQDSLEEDFLEDDFMQDEDGAADPDFFQIMFTISNTPFGVSMANEETTVTVTSQYMFRQFWHLIEDKWAKSETSLLEDLQAMDPADDAQLPDISRRIQQAFALITKHVTPDPLHICSTLLKRDLLGGTARIDGKFNFKTSRLKGLMEAIDEQRNELTAQTKKQMDDAWKKQLKTQEVVEYSVTFRVGKGSPKAA